MANGKRDPLVKVSYVNSDRQVEAVVWRRRELTGMSDQDVDDVAFLTGRPPGRLEAACGSGSGSGTRPYIVPPLRSGLVPG